MNVGRSRRCLYLLHGCSAAVVSVGDVFRQGAVEQHGLLGYDAYLGSQPVDVQVFYIYIVQHLKEKTEAEISAESVVGLDILNLQ